LAAGDQRPLRRALQLVRSGKLALSFADAGVVAEHASPLGQLAPGAAGSHQVAAQHRRGAEPLEQREPPGLVLALRPQLGRAAPDPQRVGVGLDGGRGLHRREQRAARARQLVRGEPVVGDRGRRGAALGQPSRQPRVQRPATRPRRVRMQRLASERVAESRGAAVALGEQPAVEQLLHRVLVVRVKHGVEREAGSRRGRRLGGGAPPLRQAFEARQHGVAHAVGQRHLGRVAELEPLWPVAQPAAVRERGGELLDEEREPLRTLVEHRGQRRRNRAEQRAGKGAGPGRIERSQRDLTQATGAP
jgi:hypothetical protein